MKTKLAAILLFHYHHLVLAQQQFQSHGSSQSRHSTQAEDYLSDLSIKLPKTAKLQTMQYPSIDLFLARGINKMTLDINKVVPTTLPSIARADNTVYGPVTIAGAMALLLLGSLGQTFNELANFFGYSIGFNLFNSPGQFHEDLARFFTRLEAITGSDVGQTVNFATGIFIQRGYNVRPEYEEASRILYKTNILTMDFQQNPQAAQKVINNWVSERTNKKIPRLFIDPPPANTKAIVASVLYFKAPWQYPFFDGHTKARPFYTNGRKNPTNKMAQMMVNGGEFPYYKDNTLGVEILGFPYKGGRTSMYVILPMDSNAEKLRNLESVITASDIERLVESTRITEAVVLFPKMQLENTLDLTATLEALGVNALFNPYVANLGLITSGFVQKEPQQPSYVSSVSSRLKPAPTLPPKDEDDYDRLIFTRFGDQRNNCPMKYDPVTNTTRCIQTQGSLSESPSLQSLEQLRQMLTEDSRNSNPELYANEVIHKVFIDITESGTEAAAATGFGLNRSGGHVTFRVDTPFIFFIYHEETKMILFFGAVKTPTPSVTSS